MKRERILSITLMSLGALMFVGAGLWLWLVYDATSVDGTPDNQVVPYGIGLVGLLVLAGGAATYTD